MRLKDKKEFKIKKVHSLLRETSKDDSMGTIQYMTESRKTVVNFDSVKTNFWNSLGLSEECGKSVDALAEGNDEKIYFIEFKNGSFSGAEIIEKTKDSLLIFNQITGFQIMEDRTQIVLVLVYNGEKKMLDYRNKIANARAKKSKGTYAPFGLTGLRGVYVSDVEVIEKSEFEESVTYEKLMSWC